MSTANAGEVPQDAASSADLSYLPVVFLSAFFFLVTYFVVVPKISKKYVPLYKTLSRTDVEEWNTVFTSILHCTTVSSRALYLFLFDEATNSDKVWARSPPVFINCAVVVGYMLSDFIVIFSKREQTEKLIYIVHHCATIFAYLYSINYGIAAWFSNVRLLAELSTIFVNFKFLFDMFGYDKTSRSYIVNGVSLTLSFFACRIAIMPYYYYEIYAVATGNHVDSLGLLVHVMVMASVVLDVFNLKWFYKLVRGAVKVLSAKATNNNTYLEKIE